MMVAKLRAFAVERDNERIVVFKPEKNLLRASRLCKKVGQLTVDPVEDRRGKEETLNVRRLPFQHLGYQIIGYDPVAAGELRDECLGVRIDRKREYREPQAGRPTFRSLLERPECFVRERD